jgi:Fe2+ transport system protein FeoA
MDDRRPSRACCGLVPSASAEDALRAIFVLSGRGDPALRHLLELGVVPGRTLVVLERGPSGGPLWVRSTAATTRSASR